MNTYSTYIIHAGWPVFPRTTRLKTAAVSLPFLSIGSQANKNVCRGTVDVLKLEFVTLATSAAVEAAPQNPFVSPSRPFDPHCHLIGDTFLLKARFYPFFR